MCKGYAASVGGSGATPYKGLYGKAPLERGTILGYRYCKVYKGERIPRVGVYMVNYGISHESLVFSRYTQESLGAH